MQPLPIDAHLDEIIQKLKTHQNLVITAPPGTGKTTRVPPALIKSGLIARDKKILILTPRRLAAKMAATRVADEMQTRLGNETGYQFRFESVKSNQTRLLFITEGLFTRFLLTDPKLNDVGLVIIDEFHERHLSGDIAIAKLKELQKSTRTDLKVIVMSATIDVKTLASYLGNTAIVAATTPVYPLSVRYQTKPSDDRTEEQILQTIRKIDREKLSGDILIFLSGQGEILRSTDYLKSNLDATNLILPLFAALSREEQNLIFEKSPKRKIILATNIAESSLTIDGVRIVIDLGTHREPHFAELTGIPTLVTKPISKASGIQRAGRAARQAAGVCFRLYTEHDFVTRRDFDKAEILRSDLAQTILELIASGTTDLENFPWYEKPPENTLKETLNLLTNLNAITVKNPNKDKSSQSGGQVLIIIFQLTGLEITPIGREMVGLPLHPRLARFLIAAKLAHCLDPALVIAALIAEGDFPSANILDVTDSRRLSFNARRVHDQMAKYFEGNVAKSNNIKNLSQALLTAFPDRVGKRKTPDKKPDRWEINLCLGNTGVINAASFLKDASYFIVLGARQSQHQGQKSAALTIDAACSITAEDLLDSPLAKEETTVVWDADKKRIQSRWQLTYGSLILSESVAPPTPSAATAKLLVEKGLGYNLSEKNAHNLTAFFAQVNHKMDLSFLESQCARFLLLRKYFPEWNLPDINGDQFDDFIATVFGDVISLGELNPTHLTEKFWQLVPADKQNQLFKLVPEKIKLTERRTAPIHYELGKEPWTESFLQDFYDYKGETTILNGRLALTLNLLAPNKRPLQVTRDLNSFFTKTYPELKNQLSRRYPRHKWP